MVFHVHDILKYLWKLIRCAFDGRQGIFPLYFWFLLLSELYLERYVTTTEQKKLNCSANETITTGLGLCFTYCPVPPVLVPLSLFQSLMFTFGWASTRHHRIVRPDMTSKPLTMPKVSDRLRCIQAQCVVHFEPNRLARVTSDRAIAYRARAPPVKGRNLLATRTLRATSNRPQAKKNGIDE